MCVVEEFYKDVPSKETLKEFNNSIIDEQQMVINWNSVVSVLPMKMTNTSLMFTILNLVASKKLC